jgi:hypothetical protein
MRHRRQAMRERGKETTLKRRIGHAAASALVFAAVAGAAVAATARHSGSQGAPTVTVLKVIQTGNEKTDRPEDRVGQRGSRTGRLRDISGNIVGGWRTSCEYLGGYGMSNDAPSHYCQITVTFGSRGSITTRGVLSTAANDPTWHAITSATGAFRGLIGVMRQYRLNFPDTTLTYYLIKR